MPTLASTSNITPRSAVRYRPLSADSTQSTKRPSVSTEKTPVVQRASRPRPRPADVAEEIDEWQRRADESDFEETSVQSARRGTNPALKSIPKNSAQSTTSIPAQKIVLVKQTKKHIHPLLYLGAGMLAMLLLAALVNITINWFNVTMDDIHYGRPRTFQTDAVVGHNDSQASPSHFIAINLHSHIEVIEMPGGDASHARIYMGPQLYGNGGDLVPVTLSFVDVQSNHQPDMIIHFQGTDIVFINDQGSFRVATQQERQQVEQFLQRHQS